MKIISLILTFLFIASAFAQEDEVKKIRELYNKTNEYIKLAKLPDEEGFGAYYSNEIVINSNSNSWRAVGNYSKNITFWYTDQPEFAQYDDKSETSVLTKIEIKTEASDREYYSEFFFDDDKLLFYYDVNYNDLGEKEELRYYFNNEELILYQKNKEIIQCDDCTDRVLEIAKEYKKLFLLAF